MTVGNVKGGVGKTTLAVNLAIALARAGRDVLLVDGDEQGTALAFTELRTTENGKPGYTAVALQGANIRTQVRQLAPKYADVVIDVGGRDTGSLRAALTVADVVLIPAKPRNFDLWGVEQTADLVKEAREINDDLRAIAVLNEVDTQGRDNQAAIDVLSEVKGKALRLTMRTGATSRLPQRRRGRALCSRVRRPQSHRRVHPTSRLPVCTYKRY